MGKALHPEEDPPPSVRGEVQSRDGTIADVIQWEKGDNLLKELALVAFEPKLKAIGWTGEVVPDDDGSCLYPSPKVGDLVFPFQLPTSVVHCEELSRGAYEGFGIVIMLKVDGDLVERGGHAN